MNYLDFMYEELLKIKKKEIDDYLKMSNISVWFSTVMNFFLYRLLWGDLLISERLLSCFEIVMFLFFRFT